MKHILFFIIVVVLGGCTESSSPILMSEEIEEVPVEVSFAPVDVDWNEVASYERKFKAEDHSMVAAPGERNCRQDGKAARAEATRLDYGTFYIILYRNSQGYWQNPPDDFAVTYYDIETDQPFIWKSYDNQVSTDVVSRKVRYPASIRLNSEGVITIKHHRNSWETDITYKEKGVDYTIPAVIKIDAATGDTICTGHYNCDVFVSGCDWY